MQMERAGAIRHDLSSLRNCNILCPMYDFIGDGGTISLPAKLLSRKPAALCCVLPENSEAEIHAELQKRYRRRNDSDHDQCQSDQRQVARSFRFMVMNQRHGFLRADSFGRLGGMLRAIRRKIHT